MPCNNDCDCDCQPQAAENSYQPAYPYGDGLSLLSGFFNGYSQIDEPFGDATTEPATPYEADCGDIDYCGDIDCFICYPKVQAAVEYPYGSDFDGFGDYDYSEVSYPTATEEEIDAAYAAVFAEFGDDECECSLCTGDDVTDEDMIYERLMDIVVDSDVTPETSISAIVLLTRLGYIETVIEV